MKKCIECPKKIKEGKWCSMECKEKTYKENYLGSALAENLEREYKKENKKSKKEAIQAWKKSRLSYADYLQSLA